MYFFKRILCRIHSKQSTNTIQIIILFLGFIANVFSIGVLATSDMRKHSFNQLLIALCIFDLLFIGVSIPVYSFNLYGILMDNQVQNLIIYHHIYLLPSNIAVNHYFSCG